MERSVEEIAAKMAALDLWEVVGPFNWALRPCGTVLPYFCTFLRGDRKPVKVRLLLLEGWQTFHDFVRTRVDRNYGFYSSPLEMAHFELVILETGETKLFRHQPCFVPRAVTAEEKSLCGRLLWECYGVMMRIETDRRLPFRFAGEKAMFARVETGKGVWADEALPIPEMRPSVECFRLSKTDLAKAKDLPFVATEALEVDFRLVPGVMTKESRPRCVYAFVIADAQTGAHIVSERISPTTEGGLKALWKMLPGRFLFHLLARGHIPGEVRLRSGRLFRLLRPLCLDLPFKLSLHDTLPHVPHV